MESSRSDHSTSTTTSTSPSSLAAAGGPPSSSRLIYPSRLPLPPISLPNTSSVSLVSSTAQGRPIPLSDANAADRTTALRELSRSQPIVRHPHTKTSGPPPSTAGTTTGTTTGTYSQPVLVRTYSGPLSSSTRARPDSRRDAIAGVQGKSKAPAPNGRSFGRRGFGVTLIRPLLNKKPSLGDDAKLPPLEAFSFKNIMAEIEQDIGADLDRIADICARSRYSLSNQYEIHVAPHGSGTSFAPGGVAAVSVDPPTHDNSGPTLQAISIDEEHSGVNNGRGVLVRRRSAAYGTLETIISSSRSSEEDRSKRKSAAEIAAQVRGRVPHSNPEGSGSTNNVETGASSELYGKRTDQSSKTRPSLAAAIFGPRTSKTDLVGEPATPETSHDHLVSTTAAQGASPEDKGIGFPGKERVLVAVVSPGSSPCAIFFLSV
ncbi:hypothetical protein RRF57_002954 [Xylaria bambusicola]|uniref:Uncharacterized protein n=1 Tax=Xylaria bambusicola TaxID=326684 RepID=A0AAN7UJS2_9PEZI